MSMLRIAALLLGTAFYSLTPAFADSSTADAGTDDAPVGKQAGTFMLRLRTLGVLPEDSTSSVSVIGGHVGASNSVIPEADLSYFLTDNIAIEAIAGVTHHGITATGTALGTVDVGSVWLLPPTVTVQYHFMPTERFSPYIGAGVNVTWFFDSKPISPAVSRFSIGPQLGAALEVGADYNISGHWFLNADMKQIFLNADAHLNGGAIKAHVALDPMLIGAGIGYRF